MTSRTLLLLFLCSMGRVNSQELSVLKSGKAELSQYLKSLTEKAFAKRQAAYETIKTSEDIANYQKTMRAELIERLGGFPKRTPLNAKTVGAIERDRYRVEKVIFESQPNHFVTATLYLPKQGKKPYPGVVIPSGHSATGKAAGYNQQGAMILAMNGIAALAYDPIGQGERSQLLDKNGKPRFGSTTEHTILGTGSIPLGLNTATYRIWDGIRSMDYLCSRKEIDKTKIGVTGCSGGGTLSSYLMAIDERVACAAPSCYLTSFKRLLETIGPQDAEQNIFGQIDAGLDHADYIMLHAPKPTLILAATRDFFDIQGTWDSFRQAKRLYTRLGLPERVALVETSTSHGYPTSHREPMARWMRRWLLNIDEDVTEPELTPAKTETLLCTPKGQTLLLPKAQSVVDLNVKVNERLKANRQKIWSAKNRQQALGEVRRVTGIRSLSEIRPRKLTTVNTIQRKGYRIVKLVFKGGPVPIPAIRFEPEKPNGDCVIYLNGQGKHKDAAIGGPIEKLVKEGKQVLAIDVRGIGELGGGNQGRWGGDWKHIFTAYLLGKSFVAMQVEDIYAVAKSCLSDEKNSQVHLIANGNVGPSAIHAAALEAQLFASVTVSHSIPSWSYLVKHPDTLGQLITTVHGALRVYDLPDLIDSLPHGKLAMNNPIREASKEAE